MSAFGQGSSFFSGGGASGASGSGNPSPFGAFGAKPSAFGNTSTNTSTTPASGSLFGGGNTNSTTTAAATPAGGSAFGLPKPVGNSTTMTQPTSSFFSQPAASSGTAGGGLFGSTPKPAGDASTAPKPSAFASSFGTTPAATTTTTTSTPAASGGGAAANVTPASNIFGASAIPAAASPLGAPPAGTSTDSNASKPNLFGNNLFGQTSASTGASAASSSTPGASTSTAQPAASGSGLLNPGLFGNTAAGTSTTASTSTPAASSTATPSGGLFGTKPAEKKEGTPVSAFSLPGSKPEEKKDTPAASSFGLGAKPAEKEGDKPSGLTPSTSTAPVAVQPPSMLKGKTIEEIVNKWSTDLETHVREFNKFAGEVAVWDRALIENGNNLAALYGHVLAAEREQNEVNQSLDHIEQQQRDLAATLDAYEKTAQEIFGGQGANLRSIDKGPADMERDKNYMLATDLQTNLDDLSGSLTQIIESVNSLSLPSDSSSQDPMTQIAQILSSHLESLQWIDGAVKEVDTKVTEVEKKVRESGHGSSLNGNTNYKSRGFGLR
ncbi:Nsp1-like C-terminal region-domain-containing protein [Desarmillaria tabescens]|uniref:Nucleoporin NSP1 n=1 Tax=Armillaria tabescens TaxID=1929756 RepID=A0AA39NA65_ARMTA|nr:Nsp1-like C-terminal region-domain-containing protein [Desarmillaria tabescens]KAK0461870.1 Nsp1-like C-terminal region-domain-containing protein [Desarmillaria tabescens]